MIAVWKFPASHQTAGIRLERAELETKIGRREILAQSQSQSA
jgi:hypothetical protein